MQSKNKNVRNELPPRYRRYCEFKRHLRERSGGEVFPIGGTNKKTVRKIANKSQCNSIFEDSGISPTISSGTHGYSNGCVRQLNHPTHSNNRIYSDQGISLTINTMGGGNRQPYIKGGGVIRRLTPMECERLQGFPDDWTKYGLEGEISDTQRYKMCGNGVTTTVVKEIMKKLIC